jgi:ADP-ribosylglycohydrolase/catechol 2,3-dioxygenase-like lactoylglutathione lyase family enzyme
MKVPMNNVNVAAAKTSGKTLGAFLGAAVGDALGWPNEMPARRVRSGNPGTDALATGFETWRRKSGGRFMPHEELILAGEFSDDTQLLLCSARSLLHGSEWFGHLVFKEFPAWKLYQRGGGRATKRAVDTWLEGRSPWSLHEDDPKLRAYFDAGGNGVAMRILPHAIVGARDDSFRSTAQAILLNGICTHGHPRALLGALAYGFVLWHALRVSGTLAYGQLIELALNDRAEWSLFPEKAGVFSSWREQAQRVHRGSFDQLWSKTESEMSTLLKRILAGIKDGAISIDSKILGDLGCFDRSMSGSGTICAAAAIYIASKYAPDPQNGIVEAANSKGADTDTLASMAGGLLGAIAGTEWLQRYRSQLQDEEYITELAQRLERLKYDQDASTELTKPPLKPNTLIDRFVAHLPDRASEERLELPDGRKATVREIVPVDTRSQNLKGRYWKLRTDDGQSLYIKKLERPPQTGEEQLRTTQGIAKVKGRKKAVRVVSKAQAFKLIVRDLEGSKWFYHEVLGLKLARESRTLVNLGGIISLISREHLSEFDLFDKETFQTRSIVCIECSNIEACHDKVASLIESKVSPIQDRSGRRVFRCIDLDGNIIEVFQSAAPEKNKPGSIVSRQTLE